MKMPIKNMVLTICCTLFIFSFSYSEEEMLDLNTVLAELTTRYNKAKVLPWNAQLADSHGDEPEYYPDKDCYLKAFRHAIYYIEKERIKDAARVSVKTTISIFESTLGTLGFRYIGEAGKIFTLLDKAQSKGGKPEDFARAVAEYAFGKGTGKLFNEAKKRWPNLSDEALLEKMTELADDKAKEFFNQMIYPKVPIITIPETVDDDGNCFTFYFGNIVSNKNNKIINNHVGPVLVIKVGYFCKECPKNDPTALKNGIVRFNIPLKISSNVKYEPMLDKITIKVYANCCNGNEDEDFTPEYQHPEEAVEESGYSYGEYLEFQNMLQKLFEKTYPDCYTPYIEAKKYQDSLQNEFDLVTVDVQNKELSMRTAQKYKDDPRAKEDWEKAEGDKRYNEAKEEYDASLKRFLEILKELNDAKEKTKKLKEIYDECFRRFRKEWRAAKYKFINTELKTSYNLNLNENQQVKEKNGLYTIEYSVPEGTIYTYLPNKCIINKQISGTVVSIPKGKNQSQIDKNKKKLESYTVNIGSSTANTSNPILKLTIDSTLLHKWNDIKPTNYEFSGVYQSDKNPIPMTVDDFNNLITSDGKSQFLTITYQGGKKSEAAEAVPLLIEDVSQPNTNLNDISIGGNAINDIESAPEISFPKTLVSEDRSQICGDFDGDITTTNIKINGESITVLAESPVQTLFQVPSLEAEPVKVSINENGILYETTIPVITLDLTADKLHLLKGEGTFVHVHVSGLNTIVEPVNLVVENVSIETITMSGGNKDRITFAPEGNSSFSKSYRVQSMKDGAFTIVAALIPYDTPFQYSVY